jgi:predicted Zn-dependent protease
VNLLPLLLVLSAAPTGQAPDIAALERAVAASDADVLTRQRLADAYLAAGRPMDAVTHLRRATQIAPRVPAVWYALGQAYNSVKQDALATFTGSSDEPWRQLLGADALLSTNHFADAFALYQAALERLPSMISVHDSLADIYDRTGHPAWSARERAKVRLTTADCAARTALCEFRARQFRAALAAALGDDPESRYWRARAANELALAAFKQLDVLPDSAERRSVRATRAQSDERYIDAVAELKAALKLAPGEPALTYALASAYYAARDFDLAITTSAPLLQANPNDARLLGLKGNSLLQLRRPEEAVPILEQAVARDPRNPGVRLALGRAHLQIGNFAAAIALIEEQLPGDDDGSLHVQLSRAYMGLGQTDKARALLTESQEIRRAADERRTAAAERTITAPKNP